MISVSDESLRRLEYTEVCTEVCGIMVAETELQAVVEPVTSVLSAVLVSPLDIVWLVDGITNNLGIEVILKCSMVELPKITM